jgi:hypothetical protein
MFFCLVLETRGDAPLSGPTESQGSSPIWIIETPLSHAQTTRSCAAGTVRRGTSADAAARGECASAARRLQELETKIGLVVGGLLQGGQVVGVDLDVGDASSLVPEGSNFPSTVWAHLV